MKQTAIEIRGELASVRGMHGTTTCDDISKQAEKEIVDTIFSGRCDNKWWHEQVQYCNGTSLANQWGE